MADNPGVINALKESQKEGARVIKDELKDQFKPFTDQITAPLNNIKAGISALPGVGVTKKLFTAVSTPLKNAFAADSKANIDEQKAKNEEDRQTEKETVLFEDIRDGIFAMKDGLLGMLKTAVDNPIAGILAGIGIGAITLIGSFFTQLAREVKFLDGLLKGGLSKAFSPIKTFFSSLGGKFKATKLGKSIDTFIDTVKNLFKIGDLKGFQKLALFEDLQKTFGSATRPILKIVDGLKSFGTSTKNVFSSIKTGLASMKGFMTGFKPIISFAKTVGTVLGKIFFPITIIMSIIDTVTGFNEGLDEGGLIGGIEGGLAGLINSIIGMPLDLLKSAVAFMLGMFGFDNAAGALKSFSFQDLIKQGIGAVFDFGKKTFEWFGQLFTDPVGALKSLWEGLTGGGGFIDLITKPFNMAVNWLLGLFGWSDPETEFNLLSAVKNAFGMAVNWVKGLFSFGDEDATAAGITTKLIDILLAPYNLAVNFLMGLFGFSPEDFGQEGESFSIGKLVVDAIKGIYNWFKGLLDIDISSIVDSIPGASTVLKALGIMEKSEEEKLAEKQQKIKDLQAQIETGSLMTVGFSDKDEREELAQLQKELEDMKAQQTAGGGTVINNFNNDNRQSSNNVTLSNQQIQDANGIANS